MASHHLFSSFRTFPNPVPVPNGDIELARNVRDRIFPSSGPLIPGLDYYSAWRTTRDIGGDFLDYLEADGGNLLLAMGDVLQRGLPAALLTSSLHGIIRALRLSQEGSLSGFMANIDELFCEICPDQCHATLFVARYDPVCGRLHYVNAGHEPPFVLKKTSRGFRTIRLESTGPVIGMLRKSPYRQVAMSLSPGDLLVAHTDGLCEATNPAGEEWGWRRLYDTILAAGKQGARDMVEQVFRAQETFTAGAPPSDDMTLWVGRIAEAASLPVIRLVEGAEEPVAA